MSKKFKPPTIGKKGVEALKRHRPINYDVLLDEPKQVKTE
jgi:hypothetical protein